MVDLNAMATQIKTIVSAAPGIASSYDVEPQIINSFPAVTMYFDGFDSEEVTMGLVQYDWKWKIRIYTEFTNSDVSTPQTALRQITTDVLKQLRLKGNYSIPGMWIMNKVTNGDVTVQMNQNNPTMVSEINFVASTQEAR